jgi:hypothetical protein
VTNNIVDGCLRHERSVTIDGILVDPRKPLAQHADYVVAVDVQTLD